MTTDRRLWALGLVLMAACVTGRSQLRGGLPEDEVTAFPPRVKEAYGVFAAKCSRCHTLSRPLNASIYQYDHWEDYVARMRRHPGSGISPSDADTILVFLRYWADRQAAEDGVRPFPEEKWGTATSTTGGAP